MDEILVKSGDLTWPVPVNTAGDYGKLVKITGLSIKHKQVAWAQIKQLNPAMADLLRDPGLQDIVKMFNADIFIEADLAPSLPVERPRGRNG